MIFFFCYFIRLEISALFPFILIERVEQQLCLMVTDMEGGYFTPLKACVNNLYQAWGLENTWDPATMNLYVHLMLIS